MNKEVTSIRKGNDIVIEWTVNRKDGSPYDLTGRDLHLYYSVRYYQMAVEDFSVEGNVVKWTFHGKDQQYIGSYTVTLEENRGVDCMHTVDVCDAFALVSRSCKEIDGGSCGNVRIQTLSLVTNADLGVRGDPGLSAYEVAVQEGFTGTIKEWLESLAFTYDDFTPEQIEALQKPATDAAKSVAALENRIADNESKRIHNDSQRNTDEALRQENEQARKAAEQKRQQDTADAIRNANSAANAANEAVENMADEFAKKQDKQDNSLKTSDKTIAGGINEIYDNMIIAVEFTAEDIDKLWQE